MKLLKLYKQVLKESNQEYISLNSLPKDMQELISQFFGDQNKELPTTLPIKNVKVSNLPLLPLNPNDRGEIHISNMIGKELPPIIISNGKLLDGKHRIYAAKKEGKQTLKAIDLTSFGIK